MELLEQLSIACKRLITKEPFYGLFAIGLNKRVNNNVVKTAGVMKRTINYELAINSDFWESLEKNHRVGLLKHELLHIALGHLFMANDFPDKTLFNIAADLEINQYIDRDDLPPMGLTIDKYNLSDYPKKGTKWYYNELQKQLGTGENPMLDKMYGAMKDGKITICSHETWEEFEKLSEAEKAVMDSQLETTVREMMKDMKARGSIPAELKDWVEAILLEVKPVLDWRSIFRRQVGGATEIFTRKTRRKQSKRISGFPGLKIKTKPLGAIYWDQSGSVGESEHERFFAEVRHMYKAGLNFDIIPFNTDILKPYRYKGEHKYAMSGGGTSFTPISEHFNKNSRHYAFGVILTDGYAEEPPKFQKPMIWVITPEGNGKDLSELKDWPGIKIKMNKI